MYMFNQKNILLFEPQKNNQVYDWTSIKIIFSWPFVNINIFKGLKESLQLFYPYWYWVKVISNLAHMISIIYDASYIFYLIQFYPSKKILKAKYLTHRP